MAVDRESIRARPSGEPAMNQKWDKLLFLHWPMSAAELRPHVPQPLQIDTFDGTAWIGVTPFTMPELFAAILSRQDDP